MGCYWRCRSPTSGLPPFSSINSTPPDAARRGNYRFFSVTLAVLLRPAFAATVGFDALACSMERVVATQRQDDHHW